MKNAKKKHYRTTNDLVNSSLRPTYVLQGHCMYGTMTRLPIEILVIKITIICKKTITIICDVQVNNYDNMQYAIKQLR